MLISVSPAPMPEGEGKASGRTRAYCVEAATARSTRSKGIATRKKRISAVLPRHSVPCAASAPATRSSTRESTQTGVAGSIKRQMISLKIRSSSIPSSKSFPAKPSKRIVPIALPQTLRHQSTTVPLGMRLPTAVSRKEAADTPKPPSKAAKKHPLPLISASSAGRKRTAVPKQSSNNSICSCLIEIFRFSANIIPPPSAAVHRDV